MYIMYVCDLICDVQSEVGMHLCVVYAIYMVYVVFLYTVHFVCALE